MSFSIIFDKPWRHRHPARGAQILQPGRYRVPEQIPARLAERAVAEGMARREASFGDIFAAATAPPREKPAAPAGAKPIAPQIVGPAPDWNGFCVVAASGPSLTANVAAACAGRPVVAVNDAYRLFPDAAVLYACDAAWWDVHDGCPAFPGEKWSSHGNRERNDKRRAAERYGLKLVSGRDGAGFSTDPALIHYGDNSGFQAVNLAAHKLAWRGTIALVGFDLRRVAGRGHFFGEHPPALRTTKNGFAAWKKQFDAAAKLLPDTLKIVNCTPQSALSAFPKQDLEDVLSAGA